LIRSRRLRAPLALLLGLSLVAAACGNDDDGAAPAPDNGEAPATADCIEAYDGPTDAPADDGNGDDANGDDEGNGDDANGDEGNGDDEGAAAVLTSFGQSAVRAQDVPDPSENLTAEPSGELVLAIEQEPTGLVHLTAADNAAWTAWTVSDLQYRGAIYPEPDGTVVRNADLVDSITLVSEDPQVVEYVINAEATWSDGTPITAEDFIFMWEAQRDPTAPSAPAGSQGFEDMESVEGSEDGKTVTVTYSRPYADWHAMFQYIYPAHYFAEVGGGDDLEAAIDAFGNSFKVEDLPALPMVSGGPFVLVEYTPDQSMIFERNDAYWATPGGPERIIGVFLTDSAQYPSAIANEEFDVGYPQGQLDLVQELEGLPDVTTEIGFGTFWEHIDFNFETDALAIPEVRQAIALGIDREDIVDTIPGQFSDEAEILNNRIFFPNEPDYVDNSGRYGERDVEAARALILDDLGCEEGEIQLRLVWRDPNPRRQQTAEVIQDQLAEIGIDIQLAPSPDFAFLDEGNFDIALFGWVGGISLGDNVSIYTTGEGQNFGRYSSTAVDDLLAETSVELDPDARADLFNEVDSLLWEDLPTIPLFQNPDVLTWRTSVVDGPAYNGFSGPTWNASAWTVAG
jgi:peptide/nickel transport system substrate-binding protein